MGSRKYEYRDILKKYITTFDGVDGILKIGELIDEDVATHLVDEKTLGIFTYTFSIFDRYLTLPSNDEGFIDRFKTIEETSGEEFKVFPAFVNGKWIKRKYPFVDAKKRYTNMLFELNPKDSADSVFHFSMPYGTCFLSHNMHSPAQKLYQLYVFGASANEEREFSQLYAECLRKSGAMDMFEMFARDYNITLEELAKLDSDGNEQVGTMINSIALADRIAEMKCVPFRDARFLGEFLAFSTRYWFNKFDTNELYKFGIDGEVIRKGYNMLNMMRSKNKALILSNLREKDMETRFIKLCSIIELGDNYESDGNCTKNSIHN